MKNTEHGFIGRSRTKYYCLFYTKDIDVASMAESTLKSLSTGAKQKKWIHSKDSSAAVKLFFFLQKTATLERLVHQLKKLLTWHIYPN
jgi:hypothetical protein